MLSLKEKKNTERRKAGSCTRKRKGKRRARESSRITKGVVFTCKNPIFSISRCEAPEPAPPPPPCAGTVATKSGRSRGKARPPAPPRHGGGARSPPPPPPSSSRRFRLGSSCAYARARDWGGRLHSLMPPRRRCCF